MNLELNKTDQIKKGNLSFSVALILLKAPFWGQKDSSKAKKEAFYEDIVNNINMLSWSDPIVHYYICKHYCANFVNLLKVISFNFNGKMYDKNFNNIINA